MNVHRTRRMNDFKNAFVNMSVEDIKREIGFAKQSMKETKAKLNSGLKNPCELSWELKFQLKRDFKAMLAQQSKVLRGQ